MEIGLPFLFLLFREVSYTHGILSTLPPYSTSTAVSNSNTNTLQLTSPTIAIPTTTAVSDNATTSILTTQTIAIPTTTAVSENATTSILTTPTIAIPTTTAVSENATTSILTTPTIAIPTVTAVSDNATTSILTTPTIAIPTTTAVSENATTSILTTPTIAIPTATAVSDNATTTILTTPTIAIPTATAVSENATTSILTSSTIAILTTTAVSENATISILTTPTVAIPTTTAVSENATTSILTTPTIAIPTTTAVSNNATTTILTTPTIAIPTTTAVSDNATTTILTTPSIAIPTTTAVSENATTSILTTPTIAIPTNTAVSDNATTTVLTTPTITIPTTTTVSENATTSILTTPTIAIPTTTAVSENATTSILTTPTIAIPTTTAVSDNATTTILTTPTIAIPTTTAVSDNATTTILTTPTIAIPTPTAVSDNATTSILTTSTIAIPTTTAVSDNATTSILTTPTIAIPTTTAVSDNATTSILTTPTVAIPTSTAVSDNATTAIPGNLTTAITTSLSTVFPDNVSTTIPNNATTAIPGKFTTAIPTTLPTIIPDTATTTTPDNATTPIPDNATTTHPANLTTDFPTSLPTVIPDNATTAIPDSTTFTIPTTLITAIPITTTISDYTTIALPTTIPTVIPTTSAIPEDTTTTDISTLTTAIPDNLTTTIPGDLTTTLLAKLTTTIPETSTTTARGTTISDTTAMIQTTQKPSTTTIPDKLTTAAPPAPTTSPSTAPPLDCNHGQEVNEVCLCPDEWTGEFCQRPNFCDGATRNNFTFDETVIGWFSYSAELCPEGTANEGAPQASVQCLENSGSPSFGQVQKLDCGLTLNELRQNITGNSVTVANNVQILTSKPERLTPENITTAAEIVTELLDSTSTVEVAVAAVATVSQLLNANFTAGGAVESSTTSSLTARLESLSLRQDNNLSQLVQPNLVVQSVGLGGALSGVEFLAQTGLSNQFVANRIRVNTSASQLNDSSTSTSDVQIFIHPQPGKVSASAGFVLYQNDQLFQSVRFRTPRGSTRRVISASLSNRGNLGRVEMRFKPTNVSNGVLHDFACVFWDYDVDDWSTKGCRKHRTVPGILGCTCNHTTNFAVLMSFRNDYSYAEELNWISILGCSLSITGVSFTIIFYILTRKSRKANVTLLMVSICSSLLVFYLLFLFGINNQAPAADRSNVLLRTDEYSEHDHGSCTAITALLHYFLLATFTWNTLYGTQIFLMIHNPIAQQARPFTITALVIGWGLPATVVAVTLGATYSLQYPLDYRQEEFCWLAALDREEKLDLKKPMLWGFLFPVALMLLYNSVILVYFTVVTCRTNPNLKSTRTRSPMKKLLGSFSLSIMLGLSWVLGYLLLRGTENENYILSIIFCILTSTQGLQIFILFVARTSLFKNKLSRLLPSIPAPEITLHHKKFILWRHLSGGSRETYRPTEDQFTSQI